MPPVNGPNINAVEQVESILAGQLPTDARMPGDAYTEADLPESLRVTEDGAVFGGQC